MKYKTPIVAIILLLILSAFLALSFIGITRTYNTIKLDSNDPYEIRNYNLPQFARLDGSFTIDSQGNQTVNFWVNSPNGKTIFGPLLANETTQFNFKTIDSGVYTLYFDNDYEFSTQKTIAVSFDTQFGVLGFYVNVLDWIALSLAVILLLVIILSFVKNKQKASNIKQ